MIILAGEGGFAMRLARILVLATLAGAFIWGACDDDTAPPVPVASVDVTPAADTVRAGLTTELTATPRDAQGNALTGRTITWSSDDETVATVDMGVVTGESAGTATITAESEGESGSADVTVWVGITGSWSGTIDAPLGLCPFSMSITEDAAGNITGTSELFAPCAEVTFDVDGTNNTDGVPDSVFIDYSAIGGVGSIQFDGMFDGDATLTGVINEAGCCDFPTTFTRESIAPGPPALAAAREERPRNPVERPLLRKRPSSR
jgi:hypothetical protein